MSDVHTCLNCGETKRVKSDLPDEVRDRAIAAGWKVLADERVVATGGVDTVDGVTVGLIVDAVHRVLAEHEQSRVHELEQELDAAGETIRELQQARDGLDRSCISLRREWDKETDRRVAAESNYRDVREQFESMRKNRDDTCKRAEKLAAENRRLKQELGEPALAKTKAGLKAAWDVVKERDQLRAENEQLREQLAAEVQVTNANSDLQARLGEAGQARDALYEAYENLKDEAEKRGSGWTLETLMDAVHDLLTEYGLDCPEHGDDPLCYRLARGLLHRKPARDVELTADGKLLRRVGRALDKQRKRRKAAEAANELLNEQIVGWQRLHDAEFQAVVQQRDELKRQLDRVREALGDES